MFVVLAAVLFVALFAASFVAVFVVLFVSPFNTSKISYESNENISIKELNELVKKVEPNASVTDNEVKQEKEYHLSILLIGVSIGLLANFLPVSNIIKTILFIVAYVLLLYRTTINAIKLLIKSKSINENALITISCIGALAIGNSMEGMMVIVLYTIVIFKF